MFLNIIVGLTGVLFFNCIRYMYYGMKKYKYENFYFECENVNTTELFFDNVSLLEDEELKKVLMNTKIIVKKYRLHNDRQQYYKIAIRPQADGFSVTSVKLLLTTNNLADYFTVARNRRNSIGGVIELMKKYGFEVNSVNYMNYILFHEIGHIKFVQKYSMFTTVFFMFTMKIWKNIFMILKKKIKCFNPNAAYRKHFMELYADHYAFRTMKKYYSPNGVLKESRCS